MPRDLPPPLGVALTILRSVRGWTQRELDQATGIPSSLISDYELGRRGLSRKRLEALVAPLDLAPGAIDLTLSYLEMIRPSREVLGLPDADAREVEAAATEAATAAAATLRSELARAVREINIDRDRREADELWAQLKVFSPRERRVIVAGAREYRSWALCERLCAESVKAAAADVRRALDLAGLAVEVARQVPGEDDWRARVQGYAVAHIANARRVAGDLAGAEEAFGEVRRLWPTEKRGGGGPIAAGRVFDLEASLRRGQRRFEEAISLLDRAGEVSETRSEVARILLKKAATFEQAGDIEGAVVALEEAGPMVCGESEPRLLWVLRFNHAVNLTQLGRYTEAGPLVDGLRELAGDLGNHLDLLRTLWLEGRVAAGLGRMDRAIEALEQVRCEFAAQGIAYDATLASLELAVLYLDEGRTAEVRVVARQMAAVFRALRIGREALAALRLFAEAAEREAATVEMARRLVECLQRARQDPRPSLGH